MKQQKNNTFLVVLQEDQFKLRQNLQPIGKLIKGQIMSAQTIESARQTFQSEMADKMKFEMLQSKMLETIDKPYVNQQYQKEFDDLVRKTINKKPPNFGKLKRINVRIIGHDKNGQTIVEPAHKADENVLIRIGYKVQE